MNDFSFYYTPNSSQNFVERQQQGSTQQPNQQKNVVFPEISTETFIESAREINELLQEADILANQIIQTDVGRQIMEAAQNSDTDKIQALLREIGIKQRVQISFTPHSITFRTTPIKNPPLGLQTNLSIQLVWNKSF